MRPTPPGRPTYEGRALPRPDDELVDQGLAFDVQTLLGRRQLLRAFGLGAVAVGLAACGAGSTTTTSSSSSVGSTAAGPTAAPPAASSSATSVASATPSSSASSALSTTSATSATDEALTEIPDETAGPYPGDGSNGPDVLEQTGVVRSDIRSSFAGSTGTADGVPMTLRLTLRNMADGNAPMAGAAVYVWHCDRDGNYSLYSQGVTDQNYLRGVQVTDGAGVVAFTSIFPAAYAGRWPHIHFEVYPDPAGITDSANAIATSQVALPEDACTAVYGQPGYEQSIANMSRLTLDTDNVFGDDGAAHQLGTVTGDVANGYQVSLVVPVDPATAPGGGGPGGAPGGGRRPGG